MNLAQTICFRNNCYVKHILKFFDITNITNISINKLLYLFELFNNEYKNANDKKKFINTVVEFTIKNNRIELLFFLEKHLDTSEDKCEDYCRVSAQYGRLNFLKWFRKRNFLWDKKICKCAAKNGHLECLIWARQNGCPWDEYTCLYVAFHAVVHTRKRLIKPELVEAPSSF